MQKYCFVENILNHPSLVSFSQRTLVVRLFLFLLYLMLKLTVAEDHQLIHRWWRSYENKIDVFYQGISAAGQIPHDVKTCAQQPFQSSWYKFESSDSNLTQAHIMHGSRDQTF